MPLHSGGGGGPGVKHFDRQITNTQLIGYFNDPQIILVPAVPGKVLVPVYCLIEVSPTSPRNVHTSGGSLVLGYEKSWVYADLFIQGNSLAGERNQTWHQMVLPGGGKVYGWSASYSAPVGKPLFLTYSDDPRHPIRFSGGTRNSYLKFRTGYYAL